MSLAVLASRALYGLQAWPVQVEVHVGGGLPSLSLVGLPGAGVRESRDRVRSAILSCGLDFPPGRITVNLAPVDLPKDSGRFDLPIALGVLLASQLVTDIPPGARVTASDVLALSQTNRDELDELERLWGAELRTRAESWTPPADPKSPAARWAPPAHWSAATRQTT